MESESFNYQEHLFYIEREKNRYVPHWFLEESTREEAEEILRHSNGNLLMRKHSSFVQTRKYVVTYQRDEINFRHYVVLNVPDGFLLDIDHENNKHVSCLSEIMDLFVRLTGHKALAIGQDWNVDYLSPTSSHNRPANKASENNYHNVTPGGLYGGFYGETSSSNGPKNKHKYINIPNASNSRPSYFNIPNSTIDLNQMVLPANSAGGNSDSHSYINVPQLPNSTQFDGKESTKDHDYINTQHRKNVHSYVNTKQHSEDD